MPLNMTQYLKQFNEFSLLQVQWNFGAVQIITNNILPVNVIFEINNTNFVTFNTKNNLFILSIL